MKTLYNYIDQGIFTARNIDLPKKVKYKARKKKKQESIVDYAYREGRIYKDFQAFIQEYPGTNAVEMDTVHGSNKKGNVILTLLLMSNHINNTARTSLNGLNPFELVQLLLDTKLIDALKLKYIPADEIMLKPTLLKH